MTASTSPNPNNYFIGIIIAIAVLLAVIIAFNAIKVLFVPFLLYILVGYVVEGVTNGFENVFKTNFMNVLKWPMQFIKKKNE